MIRTGMTTTTVKMRGEVQGDEPSRFLERCIVVCLHKTGFEGDPLF